MCMSSALEKYKSRSKAERFSSVLVEDIFQLMSSSTSIHLLNLKSLKGEIHLNFSVKKLQSKRSWPVVQEENLLQLEVDPLQPNDTTTLFD